MVAEVHEAQPVGHATQVFTIPDLEVSKKKP